MIKLINNSTAVVNMCHFMVVSLDGAIVSHNRNA